MKAKISLVVEKCVQCPFHETHMIVTSDSFEHEQGLYCSKVEDDSESWGRHTYDGFIDRRLIGADEWSISEIPVPTWCPFITKQYGEMFAAIQDSSNWRMMIGEVTSRRNITPSRQKIPLVNYGAAHIYGVINQAMAFLESLEKYTFKDFYYHAAFRPTSRDRCLMKIAALLKDLDLSQTANAVYGGSAKCAEEVFLRHLDLDENDKDIIIWVIKACADVSVLKDEIETLKNNSTKKGRGFILEPKNAVAMALLLADNLNLTKIRIEGWDTFGEIADPALNAFCSAVSKIQKVELRFIEHRERDENGRKIPVEFAELHYTTDEGFDLKALKYYPDCILIPRMIIKDCLGLRSLRFFVNEKQIPIGRILGKC